MKRLIGYLVIMLVIVIALPLFIVRGCSYNEEKEVKKPVPEDILIDVYVHTQDQAVRMGLEEYLKGVVAAEMPANFELEALKAQAIAARTYAFGRMTKLYSNQIQAHQGADICTDSTHCQAWMSKESAYKLWNIFTSRRNWKKIEMAIAQTKNQIITYQGTIANPLFHSNSGGKTENAEDVWEGVCVPYLRSVPSEGEEHYIQYKNIQQISIKEFVQKINDAYPDNLLVEQELGSKIKVNGYTEGGRVKDITIGGICMKGTEFRKIFSLRSANFLIENAQEGQLNITTYGYGHGVGMSQWGANYIAKKGGSSEEILKYYYQGVSLMTIEDWKQMKEQKGGV